MKRLTLSDYCREHSQTAAAKALGVSRAAISQMLENDREIHVEIDEDGSVMAWERRPVPARRQPVAA